MYVRQTCNIEIGTRYRLRGLHSIEIKKSVHQIVQSAVLQLPLSVLKRNNQLLERIRLIDNIKEGDFIKIDLGYDGNNKNEFTGYIKRINLKQPLELELEDEMYLLRSCYYKKNFKKNSVREVLNYILKGLAEQSGLVLQLYDKMPELTVTNFMMDGANGIAALQDLNDKYGLTSYLTTIDGKKVLYCGLLYGLKKNSVKYQLQRNTISIDDLKYQVNAAISYQIKIVNHQPDGIVKNYTIGNKKGEERTMHFYGTHTEAELKQMAAAEMVNFSSNGYKGSFETFLLPAVQPGDIAEITEKQFSRQGRYYVGSVTTTFAAGARRKPEIDILL
jgi:hypothetical protein